MNTHTRPLALAVAVAGLLLLAGRPLLGSELSKPLELVQTIPLKTARSQKFKCIRRSPEEDKAPLSHGATKKGDHP
jgi:hypothetical protein